MSWKCVICERELEEDFICLGNNITLCWDCAEKVAQYVVKKFFKYLGCKLPKAVLVYDEDTAVLIP